MIALSKSPNFGITGPLPISTPNHLSKLDYAQFRYIVDAYAAKLVGPK